MTWFFLATSLIRWILRGIVFVLLLFSCHSSWALRPVDQRLTSRRQFHLDLMSLHYRTLIGSYTTPHQTMNPQSFVSHVFCSQYASLVPRKLGSTGTYGVTLFFSVSVAVALAFKSPLLDKPKKIFVRQTGAPRVKAWIVKERNI